MTDELANLRSKYKANREILSEESIQPRDPLNLFKKWYDEACATPEILEPWTVSLATVDKSGLPSIRYVWLKDFVEDEGFMFFTNYASKKAQDIEANPNVAIAAYWLPLQKSVKIQGVVKKVAQEVSAKHFHSRPRATQIGFLVSPQTQVIAGREVLDDKERKMQQELGDDKEVPMPNWGGYLVEPHTIEFWQGHSNRLNDRIRFRKFDGDVTTLDLNVTHVGENGWVFERLAP